ncbi:hypothetical protein [Caballeronia concitans]|uniref:Uncharacterized protein n=1 Tax=Caballeronia concitans TaxID=1777133 RepID=A0A658QW21_9BURK|nr:hypothetical protein [Caballeronia concitans]KIG03719.1 hypothetical protein BurMR1_4681 [Burkholderia sp. MR1]SAL27826.1 hypothetical protein AWB72_02228 [Caballeronia concitans]
MNIRLFSATAVAAIGLTCAQGASAGTTVSVSYAAPAVVYAPRPVYYYARPYYAPPRPVAIVPVTPVVPVAVIPPPPPRPVIVTAPVPVPVPVPVPMYAPPVRVTYAQPVLAAPVVVMH